MLWPTRPLRCSHDAVARCSCYAGQQHQLQSAPAPLHLTTPTKEEEQNTTKTKTMPRSAASSTPAAKQRGCCLLQVSRCSLPCRTCLNKPHGNGCCPTQHCCCCSCCADDAAHCRPKSEGTSATQHTLYTPTFPSRMHQGRRQPTAQPTSRPACTTRYANRHASADLD